MMFVNKKKLKRKGPYLSLFTNVPYLMAEGDPNNPIILWYHHFLNLPEWKCDKNHLLSKNI